MPLEVVVAVVGWSSGAKLRHSERPWMTLILGFAERGETMECWSEAGWVFVREGCVVVCVTEGGVGA